MNPSAPHTRTFPLRRLLWMATGLGAGFLNGLLGTAGGILLVAVLPRLTPPLPLGAGASAPTLPLGRTHERRDILATAMAVMLPVSAVSGVFYWLGGIRPPWGVVTALILPAILGGLIGAHLLGRLPDRLLRRLFAALVVVAGARMLF